MTGSFAFTLDLRTGPVNTIRRCLSVVVPLLALTAAVSAGTVHAQEPEDAFSLRWWHPLAAGGVVATVFLIDEPVRGLLLDNRTSSLDDMADVTKHFKDKEVFFVAGGGAVALGLIARHPKTSVTGLHIITSLGLSSTMLIGTKWAFGRSRPSATPHDPTEYSNRHWLSDVALGAVYGITAAKLVNGRWTVFCPRPPSIWTDGRSLTMHYSIPH